MYISDLQRHFYQRQVCGNYLLTTSFTIHYIEWLFCDDSAIDIVCDNLLVLLGTVCQKLKNWV